MKILVATDGSRAGTAAVKFAAKLAGSSADGELILLCVYVRLGASAAAGTPATPERARGVLDEAARLGHPGGLRVRRELALARDVDAVPEAILLQAKRLRVDLVVVGSEGRESLVEWVVGGTALRLIYLARGPVTVVRAPRRQAPRGMRGLG